MQRLALLLAGLALTACHQPSPPADIPIRPTADALRADVSVMAQALAGEPGVLEAIGTPDAPAVVLVMSDASLDRALNQRGMTRQHLLDSPGLSAWLKSHVLVHAISGDGQYTNLAGSTWQVTASGRVPGSVNGVPVAGCGTTAATASSRILSYLCVIDAPVVTLP